MASECRKMCGDIGFWAKTGLDGHGLGHRSPHDVGCSEARQALVAGADEYRSRLVVRDSVFGQQGCQCSRQILRNGDDAVSAPFAAQQHLRVRPFQLKVVCVELQNLLADIHIRTWDGGIRQFLVDEQCDPDVVERVMAAELKRGL